MTIQKDKSRRKIRENRMQNASYKGPLTVMMILFFIYSFALIVPIFWVCMNTLKERMDFLNNPWAFPSQPWKYISNYTIIFTNENFNVGIMLFYTVIYSVSVPTVGMFAHLIVAYAYAKYEFPWKKFLYWCMVIPMFVVLLGSGAARYKLLNDIFAYDRMWWYILVTNMSGGGFYFLLFVGVFQNISDSYREAAMLDGAGRFRIFIQIYLPQTMSLLSALWIMQFIGVWNEFDSIMLYLPSYRTLATGIYLLSSEIEKGGEFQKDYPKLFATMICSIIPVLALYIVFQDTIMKMTFGGGVKG